MVGVVVVLLCSVFGCSVANAQPPQRDPVTTEVEFGGGGGQTLHGTVFAPADGATRHPGIVLLGGSGPGPRQEYLPEALAFARAGIVTLVYDKRTVGYSTTHRDFWLLARDALAGVEVLRQRSDVDAAHVGLWGFSEGGWVAPLAASRSGAVGFVVTIGAAGMTPLRQDDWEIGNLLRRHRVSGSLIDAVSGPGSQLVAGAGVFPEAGFDPVPVLRRVRVPVLALWGDHDVKVPSAPSAAVFQSELARAGNPSTTTRFVPAAGHNGHRTVDGFESVGGMMFNGRPLGQLDSGYVDTITDWVHAVAAGRPPATSAATPPAQAPFAARAVPWYERPAVQGAALIVLLVGFSACTLRAFARKMLSRKNNGERSGAILPAGVRRAARATSVSGFIAVVLTVGYVVGILATGARSGPGAVVAGQTLPWLLLRGWAVVTVLATVVLAATWWRQRAQVRDTRTALVLLMLAAALFVPWALDWGLLRY